MKKHIRKLTIILFILIFTISFSSVYASNNLQDLLNTVEYSENYKKYLELSDDEKSNVIEPLKYDIKPQQTNSNKLRTMRNPLKTFQLLKSSLQNKYSLKDKIPDNVKIRNQMDTNSCWAFAYTGVLESNLGLNDYLSSKPVTTYDFSERHMNYSTTRNAFKNDAINSYGFTKTLDEGGNYLMALSYLTNGMGAIPESELPFEDNEDPIDISKIQNKTVSTTVYDAILFGDPSDENEKNDLIVSMKEHISNYGGIYAGIYGSALISDNYNNKTGAIYCKDYIKTPANHAVTIIGWDDTYSKNNFNENCQPSNDGAWIVKNSWGETLTLKLSDTKEDIYNEYKSECNAKGWNSSSEITNEFVLSSLEPIWGDKITIDANTDSIILTIGNDGYMYVSYDDANVYLSLSGIQKASSKKDYYNIYQNDILGPSKQVAISSKEAYLANIFTRDSKVTESLNKVSIFTFSDTTCEVYVNPNSSDKSLNSLQKIKLTTGDSQKITPGYHTLEFETPVKLTGNSFAVVIKVSNDTDIQYVPLESNIQSEDSFYASAIVNSDESYFSTDSYISNNEWQDLATIENIESKGNLCIKALTINSNDSNNTNANNNNINNSGNNNNGTNNNNNNNANNNSDDTTSAPTPSDFQNSSAEISDINFYFYSETPEKAYSKIKIKISNIQIGNENDSYTYKYYLSGKQGETNIADNKWKEAKAEKESDGTYSITLDINTTDLDTNIELSQSDNLYVYIKETATNNNNSIENIHTLETKNKSGVEPTFYLDDKKVDDLEYILKIISNTLFNNDNTNTNGSNITNNNINILKASTDKTTANKILPATGILTVSIIVIIILIIGAFSYYRYKNILK